jgi:glycosyltransferase involved in cell wall biosynthesis
VFSNDTVSPLPAPSPSVRIEEYNYPVRSRSGRIFWDQWGMVQRANASGCEWLFLPKGFTSFLARPQLRVAAYVHDIMGDFYRRKYPQFWPKVEFDYFARSLAATIRTAEVIFTNTEFTKGEICTLARRIGLNEPRIVVAGYGFEAPELKPVDKEDRVLLFASNMPHKRTDLAIRFLDHWVRQSGFKGQIDCIGIIPPEMPKPEGSYWNWIGRVPPAKGREMIRSARVVVYVSEQEGFGMPPVEAVLEGTCPVYSGLAPIREVMNDAGCAFDNDSQDSFAAAMDRSLQVSSQTIRGWSDSLMSRHNWPAVTRKIVEELAAS